MVLLTNYYSYMCLLLPFVDVVILTYQFTLSHPRTNKLFLFLDQILFFYDTFSLLACPTIQSIMFILAPICKKGCYILEYHIKVYILYTFPEYKRSVKAYRTDHSCKRNILLFLEIKKPAFLQFDYIVNCFYRQSNFTVY